MTTTGGFDASRATGALMVEQCDIPLDMTLCEWRRRGGPAADLAAQGADGAAEPAATTAARSRGRGMGRGLRRAFGLA